MFRQVRTGVVRILLPTPEVTSMRAVVPLLLAGLVLALHPAEVVGQDPSPASIVHQVVITVNDEGAVVLSLDPVIGIPGDRVRFSAPGSDSVTIDFPEGTPFQNRTVSGSGQLPPVPILPGKVREQPYKYDITLFRNGSRYILDPEIVVRGRRER